MLISNINLEAGKMYTIVMTGGTAKTPLHAIPIEDELTQSLNSRALISRRPTGIPFVRPSDVEVVWANRRDSI